MTVMHSSENPQVARVPSESEPRRFETYPPFHIESKEKPGRRATLTHWFEGQGLPSALQAKLREDAFFTKAQAEQNSQKVRRLIPEELFTQPRIKEAIENITQQLCDPDHPAAVSSIVEQASAERAEVGRISEIPEEERTEEEKRIVERGVPTLVALKLIGVRLIQDTVRNSSAENFWAGVDREETGGGNHEINRATARFGELLVTEAERVTLNEQASARALDPTKANRYINNFSRVVKSKDVPQTIKDQLEETIGILREDKPIEKREAVLSDTSVNLVNETKIDFSEYEEPSTTAEEIPTVEAILDEESDGANSMNEKESKDAGRGDDISVEIDAPEMQMEDNRHSVAEPAAAQPPEKKQRFWEKVSSFLRPQKENNFDKEFEELSPHAKGEVLYYHGIVRERYITDQDWERYLRETPVGEYGPEYEQYRRQFRQYIQKHPRQEMADLKFYIQKSQKIIDEIDEIEMDDYKNEMGNYNANSRGAIAWHEINQYQQRLEYLEEQHSSWRQRLSKLISRDKEDSADATSTIESQAQRPVREEKAAGRLRSLFGKKQPASLKAEKDTAQEPENTVIEPWSLDDEAISQVWFENKEEKEEWETINRYLSRYAHVPEGMLVKYPELYRALIYYHRAGLFATQVYSHEYGNSSFPAHYASKVKRPRTDGRYEIHHYDPSPRGNDEFMDTMSEKNVTEALGYVPLNVAFKKRVYASQSSEPAVRLTYQVFSPKYGSKGVGGTRTGLARQINVDGYNDFIMPQSQLGTASQDIDAQLAETMRIGEASRNEEYKIGQKGGLITGTRGGNQVAVSITLPKSAADKIYQEFQNNPEIIRPFFIAGGMDLMVPHVPPPYDVFDQEDSGMLIREFTDKTNYKDKIIKPRA